MPYAKEEYWESHKTNKGKRDRYSQGSVADRGGMNNSPAYTQENLSGGKVKSYGFGKKKKKARY